MNVLLVCAVMAHLEYNHHSCPDKAWLVCLRALVHYFLLIFFFCCFLFFCPFPSLPVASYKDFFSPPPHFSTCLLYVRSIGLCQLP